MKLNIEKISFPLKMPLVITGYVFTAADTVRVTLEDNGVTAWGEGMGVYYTNDLTDGIVSQLEAIAGRIEAGLTRAELQELLPPGGARNALDCALWDLDAKKSGKSIWQLLGMTPKALTTVCTIGIDTPGKMAEAAKNLAAYPHLKIKLSGDDPIGKLEAIRAARPDAALIIDVNQGWTFDELKEYIPQAERLGVDMIEQPLKRGGDAELEGFTSVVPLGADESCLSLEEYETAKRRYDAINIKLDKCGGLTEGLEIVRRAQQDGKGLMIGNMVGTSLSMAPSYVIGQFCRFVDIDGPLFLKHDVENALNYGDGGVVDIPDAALWG
ncbi:dipeptide epimerase [Emcibacter nanhaiensis]|uniref:Dipeptide epimerase n=1 Tax=Emcibacter nanhaiensis TaxID=1505037 RepID=A0A501PDA0_9PROT|nr:dipeptide epimerase [Emcibacter nanhaiensis]TPD57936.1 dipeptide epimerase [Emcibacter nanhaiensis]